MSPGPRFPGPGLRDPGDPVPDADPCFLQKEWKFFRKNLAGKEQAKHQYVAEGDIWVLRSDCTFQYLEHEGQSFNFWSIIIAIF